MVLHELTSSILFMFYRLIIFIAILLFPCLSSAENEAKVARWYKVYWNNVYIADFKAEIGEKSMVVDIDSRGIVKKISKYTNHTYSKFHVENGNYVQEYFESHLRQRQGTKEVAIYYDKNGKIRSETLTPPDSKGKRPLVAKEAKAGVVDPLFAAIVARDKIKAALADGTKSFNFNIYDGRRLSRLEFNIYGMENIKILEKKQDVVKISFKRIAIDGFTNNELKRMKGEEPDFVLYLEPGTLFPVKADAAAPLGKATFMLERECMSMEECR